MPKVPLTPERIADAQELLEWAAMIETRPITFEQYQVERYERLAAAGEKEAA